MSNIQLAFENNAEKGLNAVNQRFLLFPHNYVFYLIDGPTGGSVVSMLDSQLGGCELETWLR